MGFWQIFQEGGWVMYPLLLFSIASWCVIIEKFLIYRKFGQISSELFDQVMALVKSGELHKAREACLKTGSDLVSAPLLIHLQSEMAAKNSDARIKRKLFNTQLSLRKYLWVLATVSSSAPFIGLFGTVVGIIRSFDDIATAGKGGFSVVASGISEALIATATGILVAVIALIFFNYFQIHLSQMMAVYKNRLEDLKDQIG